MSTGKTYTITGANRGLGLEFVRQLSPNTSNTIIAAVRSLKGELTDLQALASQSRNIHILECDTSSLASIAAFGTAVTKTLGQDAQLDYLLNNAGINAVREQTALDLNEKDVHHHIAVNVIGPAKTVEALLPHLREGSVVMNMTSGLGSCGKGVIKCAAYSLSKAALNMLTVHQAGELKGKGVKVICMDPGWVKTRMGGEGAGLEPATSIGGMLKVVHGLAGVNLAGVAKFYAYDGSDTPW
jgi:NAD(P)-dependent dehydrogenase (short-subunit alcohol dehydrogenase family)